MFTTCRLLRRLKLSSVLFLIVLGQSDTLEAQITSIKDIGIQTGFQDTLLGHHKRGRAGLAADFDLDGYVDFYIGNPGDESLVMRNVGTPRGKRRFALQQVLVTDSLAWGGATFDYDNDGDYDLFITCGANEGIGYNYLFRNDWILDGTVTGELSFADVTRTARVAGPLPQANPVSGLRTRFVVPEVNCCAAPPCEQELVLDQEKYSSRESSLLKPVRTASANAVVADYDQDGDDDIFVNGNIHSDSDPRYPELIGRNTLWRNNGDGTFTDATYLAGLGSILEPTRHSTFLDYDNDGDADLYENNFSAPNYLWRNNGNGTFTDVTTEASGPGDDLHYPWGSFASASADFNNDGWEDIMGFMRNSDDHSSPYEDGHTLFINNAGVFTNIAAGTVINDNYVGGLNEGVMGCMVGDVTGDGLPDIYVGNGGPDHGVADQFYVSVPGTSSPSFVDNTPLIDFPATIPPGIPIPPYPYRTHGTSFVDVDNDGYPEIGVVNGGPSKFGETVREPNRLFRIQTTTPYSWFKVRPVGNGTTVAKDAAGARIRLDVSNASGDEWSVYRTLFVGSGFSAQNGFELHFGLRDADTIRQMDVGWPNGEKSTITEGLEINSSMVITMDGDGNTMLNRAEVSSVRGQQPSGFRLDQNHPNPFNPTTQIGYALEQDSHVSIVVYDVLGRKVVTLVDEVQPAGYRTIVWDGNDGSGHGVTSGVYFYRFQGGDFVATKKLMVLR